MGTGIGIIGASGYAGIEATRILARHPRAEVRLLASDRFCGETAERRLGPLGAAGRLRYLPIEGAVARAGECEAVLLATPAEASLALAPALLEAGVRVVIDLSGAFRLRDGAAFKAAYALDPPSPRLLGSAIYGLPELIPQAAQTLRAARLVGNPGCYATAAALALAPLLEAGLLAPEALIVDAASGTTGAGRKASEEFSFSELHDDFRAYRVLRHQHTPEIAQTLQLHSKDPVRLTFTPHLLPVRRGILATCYARAAAGVRTADCQAAMLHKYAATPAAGRAREEAGFVGVADSPDEVRLSSVVGTNRCLLSVLVGGEPHDPGRVVVVAALDNLVKGAAGQAVQNLNLCMGWRESEGLDQLRGSFP